MIVNGRNNRPKMARVSQSPTAPRQTHFIKLESESTPCAELARIVPKFCSCLPLPQLIARLLLSRHEMIVFLGRIPHLLPNISKEPRVRIRRLLFVFAFILLGGSTPLYAALGDAPRCLLPAAGQGTKEIADANLPIPKLRPAVPSYDAEERDYFIRTIAFEASGEPEEGKVAVAYVILNRKKSGKWGDNIKDCGDIIHGQFEPWMTRRREMEGLSPNDPRYQSAAIIADAVLSGQTPDPTAGATYFLNPIIVRERRGGSLPAWASGEGRPIGRHTFYSPNEGDAAPQPAVYSIGLMADSAFMLMPRRREEAATGRVYGGCGQQALTARSPDLPTDNLVQLDAR